MKYNLSEFHADRPINVRVKKYYFGLIEFVGDRG